MLENIPTAARLGRQLREQRRQRGWTLTDVAARLATSQPSRISELEGGKANARTSTLDEVGQVLGLSLLFIPNDKL